MLGNETVSEVRSYSEDVDVRDAHVVLRDPSL